MRAYEIETCWIAWAMRQKKEPKKPFEIRLPFGGGWLNEVREAREARRREAYRLKRRSQQPKR